MKTGAKIADVETTCLSIERPPHAGDADHLEKALEAVPGVSSVEIDVAAQVAIVRHRGADVSKFTVAVAQVGYRARLAGE